MQSYDPGSALTGSVPRSYTKGRPLTVPVITWFYVKPWSLGSSLGIQDTFMIDQGVLGVHSGSLLRNRAMVAKGTRTRFPTAYLDQGHPETESQGSRKNGDKHLSSG